MILSRIKLEHFRNYSKRVFEISSGITLILGANATGKTAFLEAIALMATGKSFRADSDMEMLAWGSEVGRVKAETGDTALELLITNGMVSDRKTQIKKYLVNGIPRRLVDFVGNLKAVLFWPEDLDLVTGSPGTRRRYLDRVLVQVDREYRRNLYSYEKGLRQRNRLLDFINEGKATRNQLFFWNQLLIKAGGYITDKRMEYISYVNGWRSEEIGQQKEFRVFHLEYDKSVISESRLDQYKDAEIAAKSTLVGPQRDDFLFKKQADGKREKAQDQFVSLSAYGSRGEQRLGVLWLKLAELSYIKEKTGDRPILLLDDIFSELDEENRELVFGLITKQQTILTSTEDEIRKLLLGRNIPVDVISLDDGR